ncbi:uncharacterized protein CTRU02_211218 [Colletotrichum truncatum]|uniref:Uncharacterized protein n=1 Tax=Colletotrichum truncatum TaxID=5467 RepID=A0ACC3YR74_COLTU|nr:uncharacterized protein CTRU02_01997 [Colletotrichum truncatum]KAF6799126.1 hypothetical protein CTRU02_01997 [Colletotrichum truncatum]
MTDHPETQASNTGQEDSNKATSTASHPTTKEEYLSKFQQATDDFIAKNPELASSPAFTPSTYIPGIEFIVDCQEYLDAKGNERFTAAMRRYTGHDGLPPPADGSSVFDEVRAECRTLLEGRADLQARWDEVFGDREVWRKLHDAVKQGKGGEDAKVGASE